jgi:transcriptional regulator with XRE-family HTH domain
VDVANDPRLQLGKAIRKRRISLGLTQEQLAERADLHWTYVSGIERGERNVAILNIARLAKALETTVSSLTKTVSA